MHGVSLHAEPPNPFAEPDVEQRLRENDKTRAYMDDPGFRQKLRELAKDTKYLAKYVLYVVGRCHVACTAG